MSGLTHTKIPTAYLFGEKNAYSWNSVRGCDNHSCPLHPLNTGKCWAAKACNEWAGPWAKAESDYPRSDKQWLFNQVKIDLERFKPHWFQSQFDKKFPKKRSCILTGYQADLAFAPVEWTSRIISKILDSNRERKAAGLPLHIFQFLTKAPGELYPKHSWPENCWLGITAMNQQKFDDGLASIGGMRKRLTYAYLEPLTENIDIINKGFWIDWIIVGGGPDPLNPDWVRSIRDQCKKAGISFYFKGWSQWLPKGQYIEKEKNLLFAPMQSASHVKVSKNEAGNWIDGEKWEKFPEVEDERKA